MNFFFFTERFSERKNENYTSDTEIQEVEKCELFFERFHFVFFLWFIRYCSAVCNFRGGTIPDSDPSSPWSNWSNAVLNCTRVHFFIIRNWSFNLHNYNHKRNVNKEEECTKNEERKKRKQWY